MTLGGAGIWKLERIASWSVFNVDTSLIEYGARDLDQLLFKEITQKRMSQDSLVLTLLTLTAVMMSPWTRPQYSTVIDGEN